MQSKMTSSRRKRARVFVPLAALVALSIALSGCTGGASAGAKSGNAQTGKVTLNFWNGFTGSDGPALQKVIDSFNASQDKVVVKSNIMPWDVIYQKVLTAITSKDGPNLLALPSERIPQYAQQGVLSKVDDFYSNKSNETGALAPAAVTGPTYHGVKYGVPVSYTNIMMYYNKDILAAAGIAKPPTTWDEFAADVPKLTVDKNGDGKPEQYAIALPDHDTLATYPPLLWGTGGGIVSKDGKKSLLGDEATIKAAQFWVDLVTKQHASPIGLSGGDADKLFTSGKAAFEIAGPWLTNGFDAAGLHYGVVRPFAGPTKDTVLAITTSITIPASDSSQQKAAAYTFFKYLNSKKSQVTWAVGSGFPTNRTDISAKELSGNKWSAVFGDKTVSKSARLYLPGLVDYAKINDAIFVPALQKALNGEGSVRDLFTAASTQLQGVLGK